MKICSWFWLVLNRLVSDRQLISMAIIFEIHVRKVIPEWRSKIHIWPNKAGPFGSVRLITWSTFVNDLSLGYYADTETKCQVFHICASTDKGELTTVSFLCPNGTIFNQNYFICDWWFNFDCAEAEGLYSLNDKIAAEREELAAASSDALSTYSAAAPVQPAAAPANLPAYTENRSGRSRQSKQRNIPRFSPRGF